MIFDVIIIGAGVIGSAIAYELSKRQVSVLLLEKENDVSVGTTKANSAIAHAGYDPEPETLMAKLNVQGSEMMGALCERLAVSYKQVGSLVVAFSEKDMEMLRILLERGEKNGVKGLKILDGSEAKRREPNLSGEVRGALFAPTAAIIDPWGLCLALAETAVKNDVVLKLSSPVTDIERLNGGYLVTVHGKEYRTSFVINCAGTHCAEISAMAGAKGLSVAPSKGQYYLLDTSAGKLVNGIIFQCPSKLGKGVLVAPTVGGNLLAGPNSSPGKYLDDVSTDGAGLELVRASAARSVPAINFRETIRNFSGERAILDGYEDFLIEESAAHFINVAGIKSPGLTAAPAIALYVLELLENSGLRLPLKESFCDSREHICFSLLSYPEKAELIKQDSAYGRIICRCESVTEGEILAALRSPITPTTLDGIKRRCGAGLGRCQGGFCSPRVQELIARELNLPLEEVLLEKAGTVILTGKTKDTSPSKNTLKVGELS